MDNILLGLLFFTSRTIYQLRERIEKGLHLMYSSSMGSIQAAVKKLLGNGYIRYEETVENGKYKKIYSITDTGKQYFLDWVNGPIEMQNMKNPELVKVYFMGLSDKKNRDANIVQHLSHLREQYLVLQAVCEEGERISVPEEQADILFYQLATARYGRDFMEFHISWYENLLKEMKNEKTEVS